MKIKMDYAPLLRCALRAIGFCRCSLRHPCLRSPAYAGM